MNLDDFFNKCDSLTIEDQRKLREVITDHYVAKENVVELQKELNSLAQENNVIKQDILKKFSKKEYQTIAFQLGKGLMDTFKGKNKLVELPLWGAELFIESIQRKEKNQLNPLQNALYPLVEYKEHFSEKDYKKLIVSIMKNAINKIEKTEQNTKPALAGEYKIVESNKLESLQVELKPVVEVNKNHIVQELQKTNTKAKTLKIACIMDEFTYFCFSPEAELLQLTPENWLQELNEFRPDLLFIESAWQGKESLWKAKVSQNSAEVVQLIKFCKLNSIKTMFWNKEDPVHFGTFIDIAKQVDVVFTTDIDCIGRYKAEVMHENVYLMPFAAQPKTHNPIEIYARKDAFNFAGSFYLKYPERQRDFVNLTDVALKYKELDIYDRNYNNPHPHYQFPDQYKPYILGRLEPHEIDKAYKGYVYGINMNTIKQSQSMFARRVFEMVASNTIVLSNYSRGVRNFFGDLVLCSDNKDELLRKIELFANDTNKVNAFKLLGLRKVLAEHTYEDRIQYILEKLKINHKVNDYSVVVLAKVESVADFERIVSMYKNQKYADKQLFILNQNKLELSKVDQIQIFEQSSALFNALEEVAPQYIAFMSASDHYLADYLTDMMLSFKYLKSHDVDTVTKDAYYSKSTKQLNKHSGIEYQFVDQFQFNKMVTAYNEESVQWIEKFFINPTGLINAVAFSIDSFNYVSNCNDLAELELEKVSGSLSGLDQGVELKHKLLPMAEQIQPFVLGKQVKFEFDHKFFKEHVVSDNKFVVIKYTDDKFIIQSNLEKTKHRYLTVLEDQVVTGTEIELDIQAQSEMNLQAVIEFYNQKLNKIDHTIFDVNERETIKIPQNSQTFKLSLRLKGNGEVNLNNIIYQQCKLEDKVDESINSNIVVLDANLFSQELIKGSSTQIQFSQSDDHKFVIKTTLAPAKHAYMYLKRIFSREELNLVLNSEFEFKAQSTAEDVRIVFEFQDEHKQKISHSMNPILGGHALAIPMECKFIRIGLKVVGAGITEISGLHIGVVKNPIRTFIPKSDVLVLAKQYPSYDDLYKYGFLHTRLKAYKQESLSVDMFKVTTKYEEYGFTEFEGIDLLSHNHEMLDQLLSSGIYKKVCIHLIDKKIWDVVKKYQDKVQILIWIHGAEIQTWQRREFEFENFTEAEIVRQKKLSDQRKRFWRNMLLAELHSNTQFIFVSQYFREESEQDLEVKFPDLQSHIIHNYIDGQTFAYKEKSVAQRFKLLSIRPFASRKYANDMTVNAILELAKKPNFKKFDIAIYGDGVLFDEITAPLKQFSNVKLNKTFLTHGQIADLHKQYGVFIVPTRMDSQGVSRDEAMASGLVPVTTAVTAIPEFVDNTCGLLVEGEDYIGMANKIYHLSKNIKHFKQLSLAATKRVNKQSGYDATIMNEISLLG